ncbi:MSCRAMM family protein, partial [Schaalia sp. lx-100]|uniref:MSCRAMM family protein n=1 Tax=Schaalia sp. lx-100 TaxID=2899081 RepID=UPI001E2FEB24
ASLVNYVLNAAWKQDVSVREDGQDVDLRSVPVTNQLIRGTIKVKKLGEQADAQAESVPLEGVVFSLFAKSEGVVSDTAFATATTGADGVASFERVPYGSYVVRETGPLAAYNPSVEVQGREVSVTGAGELVDLTGTAFVNTMKRGTVKVKKLGEQADPAAESVPLEGVVFSLFAKTDGVVSDSAFATATTGVDGVASFEGVPYGSYVVRETGPLAAYNPSSEAQGREVSVTREGELVDLTNSAFTNTMKRGTVTVTKVDADSRAALAGVTFQLKQEGVVKYEAVTDSSGVATFSSVAYGDYTLVESASLVSHVLRADYSADVAVREHGARVDVGTVDNPIKRGTVKVKKLGEQADAGAENVPLVGVVFSLFAKTDGVVSDTAFATATTGADGVASFERVPYGS